MAPPQQCTPLRLHPLTQQHAGRTGRAAAWQVVESPLPLTEEPQATQATQATQGGLERRWWGGESRGLPLTGPGPAPTLHVA